MTEQQVKELREHGQIHKHNNRYTVDLLNQAANTIESLSAKLVMTIPKRPLEYEEHENYDEGICPICGEPVCHVYAYCPGCGQHLKWGSNKEESKSANIERSNRYYEDDIFQKIISDLDKMIGIQLKIIAMLNDEVYRYGFSKSLEAYQQAKLMIEISLEEYKVKQSDVHYSDGWISCEKKMPEKTGRYYIVSVKNEVSDLEYTRPALYDDSGFAIKITEKAIAWQPLPEPYRGGDASEK